MGIADSRFGGEVISKKGKIFKFDDIGCMARFIKSGGIAQKDIAQTVVVNYEKQNDFIEAANAVLITGDAVKSPMGSNVAAFVNAAAAVKTISGGKILSWNEFYQQIE
jgi:copper chaperone NosL